MKAAWSIGSSIICVYYALSSTALSPFVSFASCTVDICSRLKCLGRTRSLWARRGEGGTGATSSEWCWATSLWSVMRTAFLLPVSCSLAQPPRHCLAMCRSHLSKGCCVEWLLLLRVFKRFNMWHHCYSCHCCLGIYSRLWESLLSHVSGSTSAEIANKHDLYSAF